MEILYLLMPVLFNVMPLITLVAIIASIVLLCLNPSAKEPKKTMTLDDLKKMLVLAENGNEQARRDAEKIILEKKIPKERVRAFLHEALLEMAQNGNTDAMYRLSFDYGGYGEYKDKNKYIYWLEKEMVMRLLNWEIIIIWWKIRLRNQLIAI